MSVFRSCLIKSAASLNDVARHAGVSTATVSRALNTPHLVKTDTRKRVEDAVMALGYTPHFGGRALASNRTDTIGAVIPTMENAIFARGLQAMEEELSDHGITLLVATSHYDPDREARQVRALLARGVDALALIGQARPDSTYEILRTRGVPFVTLWNRSDNAGTPFAGFDNHAAARAMADLVMDNGHRRIAMIAGVTRDNDRALSRVDGVTGALSMRGIELAPPLLVEAPYELAAAAAAARDILTRVPRPTAIICGNDVLAAGALVGAKELGLRIPEDVSVVGYDDIDLSIAVDPPLTTVRVPHRRMGRAAADMLRRMIDGAPVDNRCFEFELVIRRSLGSAAGNEP
ncbi:LacI family DNA-binding transcriptional regulator [Amorphus sp. MBR-141]